MSSTVAVPLHAAPVAPEVLRQRIVRATQTNLLIHRAITQAAPSRFGPVSKLIRRAKEEKDPALHRMAVMALLRQKMPLLREQKQEIIKLVRDPERGLLPRQVAVPKTGTIDVRHFSMQEFLQPDVAQLRQAGFEIDASRSGEATARKGRVAIQMKETHRDVFRDVGKAPVTLYNGHSQIGGTVEQSLEAPDLAAPQGRALAVLLQCVGKQTMPQIKAKMPTLDVITSTTPLYVAETPHLMRAFYEGLLAGDDYRGIRRRMNKVSWRRYDKKRLVFPDQTASLQYVDFDMNGVLDAEQGPGKIQFLDRQERRAAQSLMSGVHFIQTMNPYYADETSSAVFTREQAGVPVVAQGIGQARADRVTTITDRREGSKQWFDVTLNENHKNTPVYAIGAAAVFELQMHLQRRFVSNFDEKRAKVRALAFAAEYLDLIPRISWETERALNTITKMNGLPDLRMYQVRQALAGEHVVGEEQVDRLAEIVAREQATQQP